MKRIELLCKLNFKKNLSLVFCPCGQPRQQKRKNYFWTFTTTLQTKPKMFAPSVLPMWSTDSSGNNRISFGPSQQPCKQNQNKSVPWHKKPPMSQNRKENTKTPLPPSPKIDRKHSQPRAPLPKERAFRVHAPISSSAEHDFNSYILLALIFAPTLTQISDLPILYNLQCALCTVVSTTVH
jgi:hypothetical protein